MAVFFLFFFLLVTWRFQTIANTCGIYFYLYSQSLWKRLNHQWKFERKKNCVYGMSVYDGARLYAPHISYSLFTFVAHRTKNTHKERGKDRKTNISPSHHHLCHSIFSIDIQHSTCFYFFSIFFFVACWKNKRHKNNKTMRNRRIESIGLPLYILSSPVDYIAGWKLKGWNGNIFFLFLDLFFYIYLYTIYSNSEWHHFGCTCGSARIKFCFYLLNFVFRQFIVWWTMCHDQGPSHALSSYQMYK